MAKDAIKEIKAAEEEANKIINDAKLESREIIKKAEENALKEYKDIINKSSLEAKRIMDEVESKANGEATLIFKEGKEKADEILNVSNDLLDKAVNLVVERIVNFNGDS
ncbi:ATP synthase F0 subunit B [Clostridium sporogenes]|uniref:ATP synthase F0 subunit B n=1 Tax=Clostridium sporogenes TaxID=1509 RepID=UPI0013CB752C|nr:ATP synthase F0 subunit B [Clostridium sporogenes]HDK7167274.1 ATPase [Clostridium botulinum]NFT03919.1 ATP synthase F0 subunit B [Clostridium sporogenes]NFT30440.1 ATP synthase F0 subunit B [Clostridium sporogenes]NFT38857.1 ATP synthase F0 subunit B [Clostridium sporogenes]NFT54509.1 ATP synthase F0 subunit B [Clostridium sporogenes]